MPFKRKPGERAAGVPRGPRTPLTAEEKAARKAKRDAKKQSRPKGWLPEPDGQVHVPTIASPDLEILPGKLRIALEHYYTQDRSHKDKAIETAATLSDMDPRELRAYLKQPAIREIVQTRLDEIELQKAKLIANAQVLSLHFLDTHLVKAVEVAAESGDSKPLELGYERLGVRRDKNFMTHEQSNPQTRPQIYRVLEQTVTRTEQITQRHITTDDHAALLPAHTADSVIQDY